LYDGAVAIKSTRDRPAKPPLSREAVVAAGLEILHDGGLGAVTMRAVATKLDTGPASLYAYIANRDELLHEMLNAVLSTVEVPEVDRQHWREQLKTFLWDVVQTLQVHPGIASIAMGYIPTETHALRIAEGMLALLDAGGLGAQASAWAVDLLSLYTTALAYEAASYKSSDEDQQALMAMVVKIRSTYEGLPAAQFPFLHALAVKITVGDDEQRFGFGFDVLVNGLLATPEPASPPDMLTMAWPSAAPQGD
jgi:AcrR family transcriptional regulator